MYLCSQLGSFYKWVSERHLLIFPNYSHINLNREKNIKSLFCTNEENAIVDYDSSPEEGILTGKGSKIKIYRGEEIWIFDQGVLLE